MTRYRRRSEDDDSSLELLLDTMCNTFGGVMFIAISVFVIILGMTQSDTSRKETVSPEELRRNIAQMQNVIAEAVRQLQIDADELKIRLKEHDSTLLNEIAQLEVLIKELEIKKQAIELANQSMTKTISTATENKKSNKQQLEKLTAANDAIEIELMEKIQQLKALQYQQIPAHKMVFKVMQGSQKHPFFIIMNGNKAYPAGPWPQGSQADNSVKSTKVEQDGEIIYVCEINPGAGVEILDGDSLHHDFTAMLKKLPQDRIPKFFIPPACAETAFKMREILKAENIQHGITLAPDDTTLLTYQYRSGVKYEY